MLEKIMEPTLIVDKARCLSNISRMAKKARDHSLTFRPHFKTHQSPEIGSWFREFGVDKIAVSSVSMASKFIDSGWMDISIAFPVNPRETSLINSLNSRAKVNITVENHEAIDILCHSLNRKLGVFIKIDTGYGRTGIDYSDHDKIRDIIKKVDKHRLLSLKGFIIHAGHTYQCRSKEEVITVHNDSLEKIGKLREKILTTRQGLIISYGDTPSCSLADDFSGIDEIRPGNFVYYDLMQVQIGSCSVENIAVAVACPVVAKHPERQQLVIHGGAVHFSKEFLVQNGKNYFGQRAVLNFSGQGRYLTDDFLISISQEHGILQVKDPEEFADINIGSLVYIIPVHSCLSADLLRPPLTY